MCTGAKTEAMAKLAARKYARIIQTLGFPAQFTARALSKRTSHLAEPCGWSQEFTVQNIVASCDVKFPIRLEGLAFAHASFANVRPAPRLHGRPPDASRSAPVRAGAVPGPHLSHALPEDRAAHLRQRQGAHARLGEAVAWRLADCGAQVVLTGGKSRDDVYEAFENIYPVLTEFRKIERGTAGTAALAGGAAAGPARALAAAGQ